MNYGLAQGYVKFNTIACDVLRAIYKNGPLCQDRLMDILDLDAGSIATALMRLRTHRFIFKYEVERSHHQRSQYTYHIYRPKYVPRPLSDAQRSKAYRENRKIKTSSVFEFRGSIQL